MAAQNRTRLSAGKARAKRSKIQTVTFAFARRHALQATCTCARLADVAVNFLAAAFWLLSARRQQLHRTISVYLSKSRPTTILSLPTIGLPVLRWGSDRHRGPKLRYLDYKVKVLISLDSFDQLVILPTVGVILCETKFSLLSSPQTPVSLRHP